MSQWLVTVPNRGRGDNSQILENWKVKAQRPGFARVSGFEVPNLVVGTLDSLMSLSDDLKRTTTVVENVVRKVEKQYADVGGLTPSIDSRSPPPEELRVDGRRPMDFIRAFEWDYARYPRKPLPELIKGMTETVARVEDELKRLGGSYSEKLQALSALKRRKASPLASAELEDIFDIDMMNTSLQRGWIVPADSEYMQSLLLVIQKSSEEEFLATYHTIGSDIAAFNSPDWKSDTRRVGVRDTRCGHVFNQAPNGRGAIRGSPVVPNSAHLLLREGEQALYSITILRGQYEAGGIDGGDFKQGQFTEYLPRFKEACRERKITARDLLSFDAAKCGKLEVSIKTAVEDLEQNTATILRWCRAHWGEVFGAWIHLKVVHVFVESVLRYGLPVNFTAAFVDCTDGKETQATTAMQEALGLIQSASSSSSPTPSSSGSPVDMVFQMAGSVMGGGGSAAAADEDDEEEEGASASAAGGNALTVGHGAIPYVWMKFNVGIKKE